MAIYNQQQLISASNATYFTNVYGGISASAVRDLNYSWISSSALLSGSQTFEGDQIISGNVNITGTFTSSLQTGYIFVGDGSGKTQAVATSSIVTNISTGSFITTGSATTASQAVSGGFQFNTLYTDNLTTPSCCGYGGSNVIGVDYGVVFGGGPTGEAFVYWVETNFAGVTINGTGVTNATVTSVGYGSAVEVNLSSGTVTNGANYTFTGPINQTLGITGSLSATRKISVNAANGNTIQMNQNFVGSSNNNNQEANISPGMLQLIDNNNGNRVLSFAATSSVMYNGGGTWQDGPQIAIYDDSVGDVSVIGFQTNENFTDGRVTVLTPLIASSSIIIPNGNVTFNTTGSALTNGLTFPNSKIHQDNFLNLKGLGNVGVDISTDGNATSTGVNINLRNTNNNGDIQLTTSNGNIKLDAGTQNVNLYGAVNLISGSNGGKIVFPNGSQLTGITGQQFRFTAGNDTSAQFLINSSSQPLNLIFENRGNAGQTQFLNILGTEFHSASSYTFNGGNATFQGNVYAPNITGSSINTGSFATTGSNTFIGIETIQDAGGNTTALVPYSGSLIFVGKTFTSSSFSHITSSATAANFPNFIFKANNTTPTLTITGSNNILTHPTNPSAGLRYWVGSNNIFLTNLPAISSSMTTTAPLNLNNNMGPGAIQLRGPATSSNAITYAGNIALSTFTLGTAAAPADKAVGGVTIGQNLLPNTVTITANKTFLSASLGFSSNQSAFGPSLLNCNSSSFTWFGNINGNTTFNNNYYHTADPLNNYILVGANIMQGALINASGSNSIGGNPRLLHTNIIHTSNGIQNTPFQNASSSIELNQEGSGSSLVGTLAVGLGFVITGSSAVDQNAIPAGFVGGSGGGSAFLGRFNAADGIRNKSAENILVVGTGTSYSNRKTGLLIDSGSNMFVEGTFNVSGSSSFTGSLFVSGNIYAANLTGSTINTGSFITTGSQTANQTINGRLTNNTSYTASFTASATTGSSGYVYVDYSIMNYPEWTYWFNNAGALLLSSVNVSGSGVNSLVQSENFDYQPYGVGIPVIGTSVNGATYTISGPMIREFAVTGSVAATYQIYVQNPTTLDQATVDQNGFYALGGSGNVGGFANFQAGASTDGGVYAGENNTGNYIRLIPSSSQWDGQQIVATQNNTSEYIQFAFQGNNNYTDGRITAVQNLEAQSKMILSQVSSSLNFADDTAAALGGVPLGGLYRNGNFVMIRLT